MAIEPIVMPKWGLAMEEGALTKWAVAPGQKISKGDEIADIETAKIANAFESPATGIVRRLVAAEGETLPVGALLAVLAEPSAPDAEIDAFVAKFQAEFKPAIKSGDAGPQTRMIDAGGLSIRTLSMGEGDGAPLLLVHGFGSDLLSWAFTQEALAEGRVVHAFDLPGHGGSSKSVADGGVAGLAAATLALMDALGAERAHLVGHSLGGAIAAWIAVNRPERVASATLIAPAGFGPDINMAFIEGFITESRARKLKAVLQHLVADPALIGADMVEDVLRFKRLDGAEAALQTIVAANFANGRQQTILRSEIADASPPVAVIVGAQDRVIPAAHAEGLPASIPVTRLADAGHVPHLEKSGAVNEAIRANIGRAR